MTVKTVNLKTYKYGISKSYSDNKSENSILFFNGFERFLYRLNNAAKETVLIIKILL
jgi:hypothetical protein